MIKLSNLKKQKIKTCLAILLVFVSIVFVSSCNNESTTSKEVTTFNESKTADRILYNGKIYTLDSKSAWVEAVAISNGKFIFVGSNVEVAKYKSKQTIITDLEGKMAMPGLTDAHVHPVLGGTELMLECLFPSSADPNEVAQTIKQCISDNPDSPWITGGRWESEFFLKHNIKSPKLWLDQISTTKAISLADDTGHNRWLNSKAMKLAGLDKLSFQIKGGEVLKDESTGETTGIVLETAIYPVLEAIPPFAESDYLKAAILSLQSANQFGITAVKEAGDSQYGVQAYFAADRTKQLNVRMAVSIAIPLKEDGKTLDVDKLRSLRTNYSTENINTDFVKIFLDGVPSVARTAAMLGNYLPELPKAKSHNGMLLIEPEILANLIAQLDALGITVNVHAAGDRAVRVVLDAIEYTRQENGASGLMHEVSHAGFIDPQDIPRFNKLNAVADLSPTIWFPSPIIDSIKSALGERAETYFPIKNLLENNVKVTVGSDWPAVLPDMNPWVGMEAIVTRQHPLDEYPGSFWKEQSITLEQAIQIYTMNGARALKISQISGSISVGKSADMIVLNHNLFEIPVNKISDTKVEVTFFKGEIVYQSQ